MSKTLQFQSSLICGLVLCLASSSDAQTVTYEGALIDKPKSEDVIKNLRSIEQKLEAVLELLPATLSGKERETARKQIDIAYETIVDGAKKPFAGGPGTSGPFGDAPNAGGRGSSAGIDPAARHVVETIRSRQAAQSPVGRYQISSWTLPPSSGGTAGAFVIDTQTGTVWKIVDGHAPQKLQPLEE